MLSAVGGSELTDPFHGERRLGERPDRQSQQHEWVVVTGRPIEVELVTAAAPMDDDPLSVSTHGDGDRFHERAALRGSIAGTVIQVAAPQAVRAVVAVSRAEGVGRDVQPAMATAERAPPVMPLTAALIA